jgi:protoporphyrinogen oxidase
MERFDYVVVGAGVSGLGFGNAIRAESARRGRPPSVLVLEKEQEPGGYCRTIEQAGFVWDYSGHFFHFRRPEIEAWLRERMPADSVRTVQRKSRVRVRLASGEHEVSFPFQLATHELPKEDFLRCLADLVRAHERDDGAAPRSFSDMLVRRFGRAMSDAFLVPYNEKLYACALDTLDPEAMGRFFPNANLQDVLRAVAHGAGGGYNATFTYPRGGAVEYIRALLRDLPAGTVALGEEVQSIDADRRVVKTAAREIEYGALVSSAPLPRTLAHTGIRHDPRDFHCNQVLVFNLGFDTKGRDDVHWLYFADKALSFYRVGFYDNIFAGGVSEVDRALSARMSLYVEIGLPAGTPVDTDALRARVLADLRTAGIVTTQQLVAHHHVLMNPAYVHVTQRSIAESERLRAEMRRVGVHAIGRYGAWTYCSIEDNLVEARALAAALAG